jgi:alkanesulfonate monooxygenase SsuD/methylene tetrahydromethanopterin reductase-like flavin-dependent oxidoreductase (luciferase family)
MTLFGLDVPPVTNIDPVAEAVAAEAAGFDFVSASDHPCGSIPTYEVWTMLTWIAARTSRIRVATRVLGVPYRPPAIVAKMAETLDRFSGGRLILGLGGGYSDNEFRAFGLGVPSPREKVDGLEDAILITRGLWSQRELSYRGRRYHTDAAELEPKPANHIPIWLGTFGHRALELTGRLADGWIPSHGFAPPERIPAMRERIHAGARAAGRDPTEITWVYNVEVRVDDRAEPRPGVVTGPSAAVAEQLAALLPLGFTGLNLKPFGPDRAEQVERLVREVIPDVR